MTAPVAALIFTIAALSGMRYRALWKSEGPRHLLWLFGLIAGGGLLLLAFVPIET